MDDQQAQDMRDMLIEIRTDVKQLVWSRNDHENRLRKVEAATTRILAIGSTLAFFAGYAGALMAKAMGN